MLRAVTVPDSVPWEELTAVRAATVATPVLAKAKVMAAVVTAGQRAVSAATASVAADFAAAQAMVVVAAVKAAEATLVRPAAVAVEATALQLDALLPLHAMRWDPQQHPPYPPPQPQSHTHLHC